MAEKVKLSWATIRVKVRDIKLLDFNPRKISDKEVRKLMQSLEKWDVFESPVLNLDHTAISGNQRVGALLLLGRGEEEIEVKVPNRKLTKDEVKEIALLGNSHNGEWDFDLLKTHFTGLGFDLFDDFNITLPLGDVAGMDMGRLFDAARPPATLPNNGQPESHAAPAGDSPGDEDSVTNNRTYLSIEDKAAAYLERDIKMFQIFVSQSDYDAVIAKLAALKESRGFQNNSDAVVALILES